MEGLEEFIASSSLIITGYAIALLFGMIALALVLKHPSAKMKRFLFGCIAVVAILPTLYLAFSTIFINSVSSSGGPVHWHADIEIWACGREVELRDPRGLSNKIGTATLHEHNDKRIHLEGVVIEPHDASLGKFFRVIGGSLTTDALSVPINEGVMLLTPGISCGDGQERALQYFVYKTDGEFYTQQKLTDPAAYIISPFSTVPPGDCVIVELAEEKQRTEKLCQSYEAALQTGKLKGEKSL